MSAHTPGPWLIATSNSWRRIMAENRRVCEPVTQPDGHPDLFFANGGADGPDARLISCAPELLEACLALLDRYTGLVNSGDAGNWNPETEPEVIAARAAIAKATGSQP